MGFVYCLGDCLEVLMNFNNGRVEDVSPNQLPVGSMNVEITNRTAAYPGIAVFDGNAKLTIWRYQNYDFRSDTSGDNNKALNSEIQLLHFNSKQ